MNKYFYSLRDMVGIMKTLKRSHLILSYFSYVLLGGAKV